MPQTAEAEAFLKRIADLPAGPGTSLDDALKPSIEDEAELRRLFATDKGHPRLEDPFVGLVDVFAAPADIRTTRARVIANGDDLKAHHVMPLPEFARRKEGEPAMVTTLDEFKKNWAIFSENSLSQLTDWSNVVAAGGSVQACLAPLPDAAKASKRAMRKWYHSQAYPTSDVDLFLWGLTSEQAELKIKSIYEAVRDSVPWDVTCVRTKHAVSIYCERVLANPRAIVAMMRQCNTIDASRRSPSYEVRLAKYFSRGFEVYVPELRRDEIDPTIYERSIVYIEGLARLLVLERLADPETREVFLSSRRILRGRQMTSRRMKKKPRKYKGDLKNTGGLGVLEMSDYDVASLHIPYGPGWDARRIEKLVYQTDLGMNSTFNPKNKGRRLHRHPAFFGTIEECIEDCCEHCPEPTSDEEKKLQADEDKLYIRGRIEFIQENPGRQSISGSFNPIDVGEWSAQAYIGPSEQFFMAIGAHDAAKVRAMIQEGVDVNRRDHVGRTPLQLAIFSRASEVATNLIDAGARITARLADGRTALHLVAQTNQLHILQKLLEKSALNTEIAEQEKQDDEKQAEDSQEDAEDTDESSDESEEDSSEDDWDSESSSGEAKTGASPAGDGEIPEDHEKTPDILDINVADWDYTWPALFYAVLSGSLPVLDALLTAGAEAKAFTGGYDALTITSYHDDNDTAMKLAERLFTAGATSSMADSTFLPFVPSFHRVLNADRPLLVWAFLRGDPNAKSVLNFPSPSSLGYPVVSAIGARSYSTLAVLLAYGAKLELSEEDVLKAWASLPQRRGPSFPIGPIEVAVASRTPGALTQLLLSLGVDANRRIKQQIYVSRDNLSIPILEWLRAAIINVDEQIRDLEAQDPTSTSSASASTWHEELQRLDASIRAIQVGTRRSAEFINRLSDIRWYLKEHEELLAAQAGNSNIEAPETSRLQTLALLNDNLFGAGRRSKPSQETSGYFKVQGDKVWMHSSVPMHEKAAYDALYEACYRGDNKVVREMCLPQAVRPDNLPLQITVWKYVGSNMYRGWTPLAVAVLARRWDTARLIMAIAVAQYKSPEEKQAPFEFRGINLGDDSDSESEESYLSEEDDASQEELQVTDVTKLPSAVRTETPPKVLLQEVQLEWPKNDGKTISYVTPIIKAIMEDDLEAFVNICDLYHSGPERIPFARNDFINLLSYDRPEMLDEVVRRTGFGIQLPEESEETESRGESGGVPKPILYLGLNVHGKKRRDLAQKVDPNAQQGYPADTVPLVWKAAHTGAIQILQYLKGERPLAAYRYYAATHSDTVARGIREMPAFSDSLPSLLGWNYNVVDESPLTAAVIGDAAASVKELFKLAPKLSEDALNKPVKFSGYTPLLLAADRGVKPELLDCLLSKGASPFECDHRGWNIYHVALYKGHQALFDHMVTKFPQDVTEYLMNQRSRQGQNLPLHFAAHQPWVGLDILRQLLTRGANDQLLKRNTEGLTPLHLAIRSGYPHVARVFLNASPDEGLHTEDGTGLTPLEIASQKAIAHWTHRIVAGPPELSAHNVPDKPVPAEHDFRHLEREVPRLRRVVDELIQQGQVVKTTKLGVQLQAFVERMEGVYQAARMSEQMETEEDETIKPNPMKTLRVVKEAVNARPGPRKLVRLRDAQIAVQYSLDRLSGENNRTEQPAEDGLEQEQDKEASLKEQSILWNVWPVPGHSTFEAEPL
ncbi:ankyrin [Gloeophyllum trabeum ATCC 11539]|uniref:Ankyrin n=1 Tax=Gloeophyllum trabeum (strain ATCC 11539 / FP-39264 / Madison 617) TaxID=670483 RepID=S7QK79_GLOTA|nr:ankyrin [Gloeophyllum trabeum ATCC 11539]EPQ59792.1 ankyrin [Gloeophyllum trabeum ATCC 11539]